MVEKNPTRVPEAFGQYIARQVAAGFDSPDEITSSAVEMFADDVAPAVLRPIAERLTTEHVNAHQAAQANWPAVTDCDRLDAAMAELTRSGIVCRQNFSCCGNCGAYEIGAEMQAERRAGIHVRGYAFYHVQDTETAVNGSGLLLNYGSVRSTKEALTAIGHEIVDALRRHGLATDWNKSPNTRIGVLVDWKRRRPAT